ncbi:MULTISPECIES: tRNA pseudouridine(55) synthase TruB [Cupriavidus]|uniref:tRNA pseudouridine synthase B n=1 Tax=Cupriavidus pinatubonensis (strain JMP 134 / LMG 1197) TaxID=264198 RepID=TRUB_CUPPJ|nr:MULTISPECIES: tRNA pseudouridine(55) synthase TruB [Cupriavidus]Q46ZP3.1 RecName: Full=tRNA pseudouridine synthase B; AltName: Full=tRNA pseudouridine(55) synthase; Short=Psi55 synthase; AltName: Full=tRNA pseudouridylate synthase; AltName: Full=tRNA-uridine isomerase [Cupriavidus pinatubonensis JMP134]QYY30346.1 tRNA pseudouridine(55) synthase TruB [Cupriavidus pinatubonensis]TPQ34926.1 tRNA pseudouridine(55) synthase TruB [Cupriavidus pinatubonensis]
MTDSANNRPPRLPRREVHGVLLLDKPLGLSSNDALVRAKRLLRALKAGHTGTLDPLATGLLPLCFGEATKFSQDLLDADKTYEAVVRLGQKTTTGDAEGEVVVERPVSCDRAGLDAAIARFLGEIDQVPPMHSALKKDGRPLYEYARAGQTVERPARRVTIHAIDVLDCALPLAPSFTMRVKCSKGTYIRTLAEDIGEALGCGAHLTGLRRIAVGDLTLDGAVTLDQIDAQADEARPAMLAPVDALLRRCPPVTLSAEAMSRFLQGQRLAYRDLDPDSAPQEGVLARVYGGEPPKLLGVARMREGALRPERLVRL